MCGNQALDHIPETSELFQKTLCRLQSICSHRGVLPQSHLIPNDAISEREVAVGLGSFSDVCEAELDGKRVRIKTLKRPFYNPLDITEKVCLFLLVSTNRVAKAARPIDIVQRGYHLEEVTPSQHRSLPRSSY